MQARWEEKESDQQIITKDSEGNREGRLTNWNVIHLELSVIRDCKLVEIDRGGMERKRKREKLSSNFSKAGNSLILLSFT